MAGYVKLLRSIWTDPDFVALSTEAQRLYLLLISQPDISHVGIVPYVPSRWARLSVSSTLESTLTATLELVAHNFVVVDEDTTELWVRSYIIHDEAHKLTNGKKSLVKAHERVYSASLRNAIAGVLATLDVTVASTLDVTLESTVDVSHKPGTVSQTPPPAPAEVAVVHPKQVAHDVAAMLLEHESGVQRPNAWKATVAERLLRDHDVAALIAEHGEDAAMALYDLEAPEVVVPNVESFYAPRPPEHDPDCIECAGSGWRTVDFDRNAVDRCDCTPPELAPVIALRENA